MKNKNSDETCIKALMGVDVLDCVFDVPSFESLKQRAKSVWDGMSESEKNKLRQAKHLGQTSEHTDLHIPYSHEKYMTKPHYYYAVKVDSTMLLEEYGAIEIAKPGDYILVTETGTFISVINGRQFESAYIKADKDE